MSEKLPQKPYNTYIKYSGIGLQLVAIVVVLTYLGFWLDSHFRTQKPIYSILLGTFSVILGIIYVTRALLKSK